MSCLSIVIHETTFCSKFCGNFFFNIVHVICTNIYSYHKFSNITGFNIIYCLVFQLRVMSLRDWYDESILKHIFLKQIGHNRLASTIYEFENLKLFQWIDSYRRDDVWFAALGRSCIHMTWNDRGAISLKVFHLFPSTVYLFLVNIYNLRFLGEGLVPERTIRERTLRTITLFLNSKY